MNAKEAINILAKMQNYDSKRNVEALDLSIKALEKVPALEAENARLKKAACEKCKSDDAKVCFSTQSDYECPFWYKTNDEE